MDAERLLNAAKAVRESPDPEKFNMGSTTHPCGTPACVIGHYIARQDLQSEFRPIPVGHESMDSRGTCFLLIGDKVFDWENHRVRNHFGITSRQFEELFGPEGCGFAATANEAADYIERFVAEHKGSQS